MNELVVPDQLAGPWHNALIMTYGMDIPFFEGTLWRAFRGTCRNKIVLADGDQMLKAFEQYASGGVVRMLNQQYIAEGIFVPCAAHAKLILLTHPEQGRLLVGSGNLGYGGYASGGELFTSYEYSTKAPGSLNAFLAVRELVSALKNGGYIQGPARARIDLLWSTTPWLFNAPIGEQRPVRHNLNDSFLAQLIDVLADEPVEELWVMAPFYDAECRALAQWLKALHPHHTNLLVQKGSTSVSPDALSRVLAQSALSYSVRTIKRQIGDPYVHAKFYLVKTRTRAICLQGSPNLSQVAMLLAHPHGNVELANLLVSGDIREFDYLLEQVEVGHNEIEIDDLGLTLSLSTEPTAKTSTIRLLGGEWSGELLTIRYHGELPALNNASLVIGNDTCPVIVQQHGIKWLKLKIDNEVAHKLTRPVPVSLRWEDGTEVTCTNPVFICNQSALNAVLEIADETEVLGRIGDLDLDDDEMEQLLGELDTVLMIDRQSIWQRADRTSSNTGETSEGEYIDYVNIEYEQIRQHPKIIQYLQRHSGTGSYARSRLQIILSAITEHFRGLVDVAAIDKFVADAANDSGQSDGETEEEVEEAEHERAQRRRSNKQRIGRLLTNFLQRYLRGIASPKFQALAGFEVMTQNYVIFGHLLWRLMERDWLEPKAVVNSLLEMWQVFWGTKSQTGYWAQLDESQQVWAMELIHEHFGDAQFLATLYACAKLSEAEPQSSLRVALRDQWRFLLEDRQFIVRSETLEYTWRLIAREQAYDPPRPPSICSVLAKLADWETRDQFLRALEEGHGVRSHSCRVEREDVYREKFGREVAVGCLQVPAKSWLADLPTALELLRRWQRAEPTLDYYRIHAPNKRQVIFFDKYEDQGAYWDKDGSENPSEITPLTPLSMPWDSALIDLTILADNLDKVLTLPVTALEYAIA